MPRPATIALENSDGTIQQVDLLWSSVDPEPVAKIIVENYSDVSKLKSLLDQGDICTLGPEIGEPHDINDITQAGNGWTRFFARDGGSNDASPVFFQSLEEYMLELHEGEYHFILRLIGEDRIWYWGHENEPLNFVEPLLKEPEWNPPQDISPPSNSSDTSPTTM